MRQRLEPREPEKTAGALDRVNEPEDVAEDLAVVRLLLEAHQLGIDPIETLIGLGEEFPEQVVHLLAPRTTHATRRRPHCALTPPGAKRRPAIHGQCVAKGFNFGCGGGVRYRPLCDRGKPSARR